MTTILVTGATGYIGSHTCVELVNEGFNVIALDSLANSHYSVIGKIAAITGKQIHFIRSNCIDGELPDHVDGIIHFAAHKSVGESVRDPGKYFDNNLSSLQAVMEHAKTKQIPVVFSSSACVYGDKYDGKLSEDLPKKPINPYGLTKSFGEEMLEAYDIAYGIPTSPLRYFNPIGAHPSGLLGDSTETNLMPYLLKVAVGDAPFLSIYGKDYNTPDGTAIRDYIHVTDIAKAHVKAITSLLDTGRTLPPINIGTGNGLSVLELVEAFRKSTGIDIKCKFEPRRKGDAARLVAANDRYLKYLSPTTHLSVEDMCITSMNFKIKEKGIL